jgi:hypothetical protein
MRKTNRIALIVNTRTPRQGVLPEQTSIHINGNLIRKIRNKKIVSRNSSIGFFLANEKLEHESVDLSEV